MAGPMKMRATLASGYHRRARADDPPDGDRPAQGADGKIPLHFIQNVVVKLNGKTVVEAEISQAVSRNPVFTFRLKGGAKGDKIEVSWLDNQGETNKIESAVA